MEEFPGSLAAAEVDEPTSAAELKIILVLCPGLPEPPGGVIEHWRIFALTTGLRRKIYRTRLGRDHH